MTTLPERLLALAAKHGLMYDDLTTVEEAAAALQAAPESWDDAAALADFTEYFVKNYPGPNTIIGNPNWHAPKIFRAAQYAIRANAASPNHPAAALQAGGDVPDVEWLDRAIRSIDVRRELSARRLAEAVHAAMYETRR